MKKKLLQKAIAILLVMILTMTNFIVLGSNIAIAANEEDQSLETNNKNIEFGAYFKEENSKKVSSLNVKNSDLEKTLFLYLNVKNEGYIKNAEIKLKNTNFQIVDAKSPYINLVSRDKIVLSQINAGRPIELEVKIKFDRSDVLDLSLLNAKTNVEFEAIYKDKSERDTQVKANKTVSLNLINDNSVLETSLELITNKILTISGEEKRVIQLSLNTGLKENDYPVKEIIGQVAIPAIDGKLPDVSGLINLNSMTNGKYKYEKGIFEFNFKNEPTDKNLIWWKETGKENIIITCIYDKDVNIENNIVKTNATLTLYNNQVLKTENLNTVIDNQEKESVVTSSTKNSDNIIYKGKLNNSIDREFSTNHIVSVNMAGITQELEIIEKNKLHAEKIENQENITTGVDFNYVYKSTTLKKDEITKILGEDGKVEIKDGQDNLIAIIDKNSNTDENGNITVNYGEGKTGIKVITSKPVKAGKFNIKHNKIIKANAQEIVKNKNTLSSQLYIKTDLNQTDMTSVAFSKLEETQTEIKLQVDKKELSTVLENNVEIKAILVSNNEKNDLFTSPVIKIDFPQNIEEIKINSVELAYENELKIKNYTLNGKTLIIELDGKQTQYKELAIEGSNVIVNATLKLNKKTASQDTEIAMNYNNGGKTGKISVPIKIVAPTDVTTINSIPELSIEEIEQNVVKERKIAINAEKKTITPKIQIINNKTSAIENIRVVGTFPTNNEENSMNIMLTSTISISNAKVYYTENIHATEDIEKAENGWKENLSDLSKARKYLILIDKLEPQSEVIASYSAEIPEKLEYNQEALCGYSVKYIDSTNKTEGTIKAADIKLITGKGPILEANLKTNVGTDILKSGDTVIAGEVIKYTVEISNTGTEEVNNAKISIPVPEGTKYVRPKENYEYIGAGYYEEVNTQVIEDVIEKLAIGEKITRTYEMRVDKDIQNNKEISAICELSYGEVKKASNVVKLISESGDARVTVKRVTDRKVDLYENGSVRYFAIIENTSKSDMQNVKIHTNLNEKLTVSNLELITGMIEEDIKGDGSIIIDGSTEPSEEMMNQESQDNDTIAESKTDSQNITYDKEINIGELKAGEKKVLSYSITIPKDIDKIDFSVKAVNGDKSYRSNMWTDIINKISIDMEMVSNIQDTYVKSGDNIEYTITLKNKSNAETTGLKIKDDVPSQISINKITVDNEELELTDSNNIIIPITMGAQKQSIIKISGVINYSEDRSEAESITNKVIAENEGEEIANASLTHIIEPDVSTDNNENGNNNNGDNNGNNNGENNNNNSGNIANGNFVISGIAWEDANSNGKKDLEEKYLEGIKVKLLNVQTNKFVKDSEGKDLEIATDKDGVYILNKIPKGKYIVVFDFDKVAYTVTKYKAEGIKESENSDAMKNQIKVDGEEKEVVTTDIISVEKDNISSINIGLTKLRNFDMSLEKTVSKISIQSSKGTTIKEYNEEDLAKIDLDAKIINGATAIVEYNIKVTNTGEVEGYAKKVVDYLANDYSFNSEINKQWYQTGNNLYSTSLANEKILPGESKILKLSLIKKLTNNNIGLINNRAELTEEYNELGLNDSNSKDNLSSADVILSVRTGAEMILYSIFYTIIGLGVVAVITIPIMKKTKNKTKHKLDKI